MFKTVLLLAGALHLCLMTPVGAQNVPAIEGEVTQVDNQKLTARQKEAFADFATGAEYYGAFVISDRGGWSWRRNLNSVEAAEVLARLSCESSGASCSLYAKIDPKPQQGRRKAFEGLSMQLSLQATRWLKARRSANQSAVMAASPYWGYYTVTRGAGIQRAKRDAMRTCQDGIQRRIGAWLTAEEIGALESENLVECRILVSIKGVE